VSSTMAARVNIVGLIGATAVLAALGAPNVCEAQSYRPPRTRYVYVYLPQPAIRPYPRLHVGGSVGFSDDAPSGWVATIPARFFVGWRPNLWASLDLRLGYDPMLIAGGQVFMTHRVTAGGHFTARFGLPAELGGWIQPAVGLGANAGVLFDRGAAFAVGLLAELTLFFSPSRVVSFGPYVNIETVFVMGARGLQLYTRVPQDALVMPGVGLTFSVTP